MKMIKDVKSTSTETSAFNLLKNEKIIRSDIIYIMKKISNETKALIAIEFTSALCGTIGVVLGIFSLLSLSPDIWGGTEDSRQDTSFIFTCLTVFFDSISTLSAIIAFKFSAYIINQKTKNNLKISIKEKLANRLDLYSFAFGFIGLILSILSLIFLFPFANSNTGSEVATMLSIVCDSISAILVIWVISIMIKISYEENHN